MKYRTLINGQKVQDCAESVKMTIDSKSPRKWAFVDMENGQVWMHKSRLSDKRGKAGDFYCADMLVMATLKKIANNAGGYIDLK